MTDQYLTRDKTLEVTCVGHASIMMRYGEQIIHVDPYGDVADYGQLPDADLILITHHHGDHFDTLAIAEIERPTTQIIGSPTVIRELKRGKALRNGSQTVWNEIPIRAVPAYNRISMRSPGEATYPYLRYNCTHVASKFQKRFHCSKSHSSKKS